MGGDFHGCRYPVKFILGSCVFIATGELRAHEQCDAAAHGCLNLHGETLSERPRVNLRFVYEDEEDDWVPWLGHGEVSGRRGTHVAEVVPQLLDHFTEELARPQTGRPRVARERVGSRDERGLDQEGGLGGLLRLRAGDEEEQGGDEGEEAGHGVLRWME